MSDQDLVIVPLADILGAEVLKEAYEGFDLPDYDSYLKELKEIQITLEEDPVARGVNTLNVKIAQVDAYKTRAATVVSTAIENENDLEGLYKQALGVYKREYDARLVKPPVITFSNKEGREGACNSLLAHLKELVNAIEGSYSRARAFTKIAYNELSKLDSINKNISRQITVIQLANEIGEIGRPSTRNPKNNEDYILNDDDDFGDR